jgi:molybdate transport system substrate-binding protein
MTSATRTGVRLLTAVAIKSQITELIEMFGRSHDLAVDAAFDLNPNVPKRILSGEPFDVGMTNPWYVGELISEGKVDAGTHVPFGRIPLAIARRGGSPNAVQTSHEKICKLLLRAESIAYTSEGTSGKTFLEVARRLGVSNGISLRAKPMGPGQPVIAAAAGEAELAVAPLTVVMAAVDVETVAIFPPDLRADIDMSMFLSTYARRKDQGMQLLELMSDRSIDSFLASKGVVRFGLA